MEEREGLRSVWQLVGAVSGCMGRQDDADLRICDTTWEARAGIFLLLHAEFNGILLSGSARTH